MKTAFFAALALLPTPAFADDVMAGVAVHGVDVPWARGPQEDRGGVSISAGYRFASEGLAPYIYGSVNTDGRSNLLAAGISYKLGTKVYVRPAFGMALTTNRRTLGSWWLFAPELAVGVRIGPRTSIEAMYQHYSHASLGGPHNPGLDMVGLRLNHKV